MSDRIGKKFAALKGQRRKALITFVMGGDPDLKMSSSILERLPAAGADLIEIGMPFSDPMADGPVIQASGLRALEGGTRLKDVLMLAKTFRKKDDATPIILMGYYNPVYHFGVKNFCTEASAAGVDGVILVDLPPEEEEEFTGVALPMGIQLIRLITPTTDDARLTLLNKNAGGFLYYVSIAGVTGTKSADMNALSARVTELKAKCTLPVAIGFGIKTPEQASRMAAFGDAVVVGSALVEKIRPDLEDALAYVRSLRMAIDNQ